MARMNFVKLSLMTGYNMNVHKQKCYLQKSQALKVLTPGESIDRPSATINNLIAKLFIQFTFKLSYKKLILKSPVKIANESVGKVK